MKPWIILKTSYWCLQDIDVYYGPVSQTSKIYAEFLWFNAIHIMIHFTNQLQLPLTLASWITKLIMKRHTQTWFLVVGPWITHESHMNHTWIINESHESHMNHMNPTWIPHESHMNPTWIAHESHMNPTWIGHESHMNCTWITWILHESHMNCTWIAHELHMNHTWIPHELHMNHTWVAHESHMNHKLTLLFSDLPYILSN